MLDLLSIIETAVKCLLTNRSSVFMSPVVLYFSKHLSR